MTEQESFIKRLYILLEETNTTQRELAKKIKVTEVTISRYLSGERIPRMEIINKIAKYFGVSVDYLLGRTDIKKPAATKEVDEEFMTMYGAYKQLSDTDKGILRATLDAIVNAKKEDK